MCTYAVQLFEDTWHLFNEIEMRSLSTQCCPTLALHVFWVRDPTPKYLDSRAGECSTMYLLLLLVGYCWLEKFCGKKLLRVARPAKINRTKLCLRWVIRATRNRYMYIHCTCILTYRNSTHAVILLQNFTIYMYMYSAWLIVAASVS